MRRVFIAIAALGLAACDSGTVPSPVDRQAGGAAETAAIDLNQVTLRGDGMIVGPEAFYFAAGQTEVETALAGALGDASERAEMPECGAGPMASTGFPGGLTVNFQDGNLVGWVLGADDAVKQGGEQRVSEASIIVASDAAIGTSAKVLEAIPGYSPIEDSTLGEEFFISGEVAGFVEDDAVSMLYSGVQCFFR